MKKILKRVIQRFAFVGRGDSWVPSPLAGEGQGEGKNSGNESIHPNEKRWNILCLRLGIRRRGCYCCVPDSRNFSCTQMFSKVSGDTPRRSARARTSADKTLSTA
jgi:hypothetical protein